MLKYWLPVFVWAIIIFIFSANPTNRASEIHWQDFVIKKSAHLFVYSVLTILLYRAFFSYHLGEKLSAKYTLVFNVLYAISDEFHQGFIPGREPTLRDILIDTFAIITILFLINNVKWLPDFIKAWAYRLELIGKDPK